MAIALALDAMMGWPDGLYRRIGHPVTWLGHLIHALDRTWNRAPDGPAAQQFAAGGLTVAVCMGVALAVTLPLSIALSQSWGGIVLLGVLAWPLVAARSLHSHVAAVAAPLAAQDTGLARVEVAKIVGRDPNTLDSAGIARATVESLAENTSDGVTAPLFWGALFGLPGIAGYKAINTMDSMIGYRTPRHLRFGRVAARLDDVVNWIPARLTAALFTLLSHRPAGAWRCAWRDAGLHRSPNAGWPEAAMAGGLGIRLSGPRVYDEGPTQDPFVNADAPDPTAQDILAGLALFRRATLAMGIILLTLGLPALF